MSFSDGSAISSSSSAGASPAAAARGDFAVLGVAWLDVGVLGFGRYVVLQIVEVKVGGIDFDVLAGEVRFDVQVLFDLSVRRPPGCPRVFRSVFGRRPFVPRPRVEGALAGALLAAARVFLGASSAAASAAFVVARGAVLVARFAGAEPLAAFAAGRLVTVLAGEP